MKGNFKSQENTEQFALRDEQREIPPTKSDWQKESPSSMMSGRGRRRRDEGEEEEKASEADAAAAGCGAVYRALCECHRRVRDRLQREVLCRHLSRSLAECMVSFCCPEEAEAVRALCGSAGTSLKRSQCERAQLALALCLSSHQQQ